MENSVFSIVLTVFIVFLPTGIQKSLKDSRSSKMKRRIFNRGIISASCDAQSTLYIDNTQSEFSFCFRVIEAMDKKVEADQLVSIFCSCVKKMIQDTNLFLRYFSPLLLCILFITEVENHVMQDENPTTQRGHLH